MGYKLPWRSIYVLFGFFLLPITGCDNKESRDPVEFSYNQLYKFSETEYIDNLRSSFIDTVSFKLSHNDTLNNYYKSNNYFPKFIKSFDDEALIFSLIILFDRADEHGINPDIYLVSEIRKEYTTAIDSSFKGNRYIHLANTERLIADALIKYSYHLRFGVVNPREIFEDSYFISVADSSSRDLFEPFKHQDILSYLNSIQPSSEKYTKLQEGLKFYSRLSGLEWDPIQLTRKKIVPKDRDTSVYAISERLKVLGFLDTSIIKRSDFSYYDTLLVNVVKKFQRVHGLNDDGVIGITTINRLNLTPEDYINKIKLSLERFRWRDYTTVSEYVLVNIPDFNLYVYKNSNIVFNSKVCTGLRRSSYYETQYEYYKKSRSWRAKPEDWETPVIEADVSHMVLNPTWTVPVNIIRQEIAAGVRNDSNYLAKKNFRIFKGTTEVAAASIKPQELVAGSIPYRIVQGPGSGNALGKIKFMFDNPFGVYLHDTPTRAPFNNSDRAVSHGCVRVEKPLGLSEFMLEHQSKWDIDYLKIEVGSKIEDNTKIAEYRNIRSELRKGRSYGQTTEVRLDKKVKLFIDYYTSWVDDEGNVNFRDDVYRKDKKLLELLREKSIL